MDGALDALKPKEMWKGLRGVAAPANGPGGDEARKRGQWFMLPLLVDEGGYAASSAFVQQRADS